MKINITRPALTSIAGLAFAVGACGQGLIALDSTYYGGWVVASGAGAPPPPLHYYTGTFGMEVWELNAATPPNLSPYGGYPYATYSNMEPDGFHHEATFADQQMTVPGIFTLGQILLPDVRPAGSSVVLALAVWTGSAPNWSAAVDGYGGATQGGLIAFENPTTAPTTSGPLPVPAALTGWTESVGDLRLIPLIPEPSALSLAGLGAATLLVFLRAFRRESG